MHKGNKVRIISANRQQGIMLELWQNRALVAFFCAREIKIRYKQTLLGGLWAILQPLILMVIFTLFFSSIAGIDTGSDEIPYTVFAYSGLLFWTLFATGTSFASNSLINNQALVTKTDTPRLILIVSSILVGVVDFSVALIVLLILAAAQGVTLHLTGILLLPLLLVLTLLTSFGLGGFLAALNVKFRDVRYALPFAIQALLFLTPVIYPVSLVNESWQWALYLNPLAGIIEAMRDTLLLNTPLSPGNLMISGASLLVILTVGLSYFRASERSFADIL